MRTSHLVVRREVEGLNSLYSHFNMEKDIVAHFYE